MLKKGDWRQALVHTILIVDDQPGIRLLLQEVFRKDGINALVAANGIEALHIFEQEKIECILLDVKMPGMDGIEILKRIRESNQNVPVFMMTAYDEQNLIEIATQYNVKQFFTKPFNIFEVKDTIFAEVSR